MNIVQYMLGLRNRDGGVVRAVIDLCNALAAHGHQVTALTTDAADAPHDWDGHCNRPQLQVLTTHPVGQGVLTRASRQQARQIVERCDVLHLHVPWDLICGQLARIARGADRPYVVSLHGMLDDWTMRHRGMKKRLYLALAGRRMLEGAAFVQCSAQVEMEQSAKWYPRGRSKVIPLQFDLSPFQTLPGPELAAARFPVVAGANPVLLHLGRLHPIKRIELLLDAVAGLRGEGVHCAVAIAGSGEPRYERQLRDRSARLGLNDRVAFLGFVSGREKISLLQAAALTAVPSAHESFGLSLIESLAASTPVIATRGVNIWPELQASGGAVITADDVGAFSVGLKTMLLDAEACEKMGSRGRRWVLEFLDPDRLIASYEVMYREALGRL